MIKKLTLGAVLLSATLLTGCGGGGSSSTPAATPAPSAGTYNKLTNLEYKTLNLVNHYSDENVEFNYAFHDDYNDDGDTLIDYRSSSDSAALCVEVPESELFGYLCLIGLKDGKMMAHALAINTDGKIKGNAKYSATGNKDELAQVFTQDADAPVTGTLSNTAEQNKLSKLTIGNVSTLKSAKNSMAKMSDNKASVDMEALLIALKNR